MSQQQLFHFNSRPCERGFKINLQRVLQKQISIHAPARGASFFHSYRFCPTERISIHAPARGASHQIVATHGSFSISIHAPARGASETVMEEAQEEKFQFTPLREGLPVRLRPEPADGSISIHAPARGASQEKIVVLLLLLFQFTPLREGLRNGSSRFPNREHFNSRPCERGFCNRNVKQLHRGNFNSRPCERGFNDAENKQVIGVDFNSRPCERGFDEESLRKYFIEKFQFTPLREGLLKSATTGEGRYLISIHAPARGASSPPVHELSVGENFNSRPCERGFKKLKRILKAISNFNSRPCERGFQIAGLTSLNPYISIHAPARGASGETAMAYKLDKISIHAPARGASWKSW